MPRSFLISPTVLALLLSSCSLMRDTPAHHAVHRGETATLMPKHDGPIWIAADRSTSEDVDRAFESGDQAALAALEKSGKAFRVERGAQVEVIGERYNDRQVRIVSVEQAGKSGWVPYEWLEPVPKAQR